MVSTADLARAGPVRFRFGGRPALDFVNSVDNRIGPVTRDDLPDYEAVAAWAWQVELLDDQESALLRRAARLDESGAVAAHEAAIELRETLYRIFRSVLRGEAVALADVALLDV